MNKIFKRYNDVFFQRERDALRNVFEKKDFLDATIGFGDQNRSDSEYRKSQIKWLTLSDHNQENGFIWQKMWDIACEANQDWGFSLINGISEMQYTQYPKNGFYQKHHDIDPGIKNFSRNISLVYVIKGGGSLVLYPEDQEEIIIEDQENSCVAFPSCVIHEVRPVALDRNTLVSWVQGKRERPAILDISELRIYDQEL